jgi:cell division transport system permease protein
MTLLQALRHFVAEAILNMKRSWKVSLLAVVVTAVSLFLGGALFLLGSNLATTLASWESQARVVVYMTPGAPVEALETVEKAIKELEGVAGYQLITPEEAEDRLRDRSPELGDLLAGLEEAPLPASFEIAIARSDRRSAQVAAGIEGLTNLPSVSGADDDRQWIEQIAFASALLRVGAAVVGALLIAGSAFIIASVIRLAALLHREEIRVLRLVGATEFFVRGPFVAQGVLQGLLGSIVALSALTAFYLVLERREFPDLLRSLLLSSFLSPLELAILMAVGAGAGLMGGLLSVRRTAAGLW